MSIECIKKLNNTDKDFLNNRYSNYYVYSMLKEIKIYTSVTVGMECAGYSRFIPYNSA